MIYENLNARNSDTIRGIRHLPSAIVMKKSIQIGKKLHRTLAEPMQEQYTSIEEKCNKCQKSSLYRWTYERNQARYLSEQADQTP